MLPPDEKGKKKIGFIVKEKQKNLVNPVNPVKI
jgi:hypothetical protein